MTKYKLQYSDDGVNFQYYKEQGQTTDKVILGFKWGILLAFITEIKHWQHCILLQMAKVDLSHNVCQLNVFEPAVRFFLSLSLKK